VSLGFLWPTVSPACPTDQKLIAVPVKIAGSFEAGTPQPLPLTTPGSGINFGYVPARGGQGTRSAGASAARAGRGSLGESEVLADGGPDVGSPVNLQCPQCRSTHVNVALATERAMFYRCSECMYV
jgi:hypothetical protein